LTAWQRVQLSRHPSRPYTLDHVEALCGILFWNYGDRGFKDDKAMIGGLGKIGQSFDCWSTKGYNTKTSMARDGKSEGYQRCV
jgi:acetyl-CoA carboxylase carboxyl transferase subunit alpha